MGIEELKAALKEALAKLEDDTLELSDEELKELEDQVTDLTAALEEAEAAADARASSRAAAQERARKALSMGTARSLDQQSFGPSIVETTDMAKAETRGFLKSLATRGGIELAGGNALTDAEKRATTYNHTTANTGALVPTELSDRIVSLVNDCTVLYSDITIDNFKHQFRVPRHTAISSGDAAITSEGAAPTDEEKNTFDYIDLTGQIIRKTAKLSRKMAVQSIDAFEQWLVRELSSRMATKADSIVYSTITTSSTAGMATANSIKTATKNKIVLADITKAFGLTKRYSEPAPKGLMIYASQGTIWNKLATVMDGQNRPYFVESVADEDPSVQGRFFGKLVKQYDNMPDDYVLIGYPDLFRGNVFDGPDVDAYIDHGTQDHCFTGYMLFDGALEVPAGFVLLDIAQPTAG